MCIWWRYVCSRVLGGGLVGAIVTLTLTLTVTITAVSHRTWQSVTLPLHYRYITVTLPLHYQDLAERALDHATVVVDLLRGSE